MPKHMTNQLFI